MATEKITNQQRATEVAILLKTWRGNKTDMEKHIKELQSQLLEYFSTRKGEKVEFMLATDNKKHYFKVAKRENTYIDGEKLQKLAPEIYEQVVKVTPYEFIDVR